MHYMIQLLNTQTECVYSKHTLTDLNLILLIMRFMRFTMEEALPGFLVSTHIQLSVYWLTTHCQVGETTQLHPDICYN